MIDSRFDGIRKCPRLPDFPLLHHCHKFKIQAALTLECLSTWPTAKNRKNLDDPAIGQAAAHMIVELCYPLHYSHCVQRERYLKSQAQTLPQKSACRQ
jgi:hypothetical protein